MQGLNYRVAVSFILPVSQLTENIIYKTHITLFSVLSMPEQIAQLNLFKDSYRNRNLSEGLCIPNCSANKATSDSFTKPSEFKSTWKLLSATKSTVAFPSSSVTKKSKSRKFNFH
jgi:hypothetical protein